MSNLCSLLAQKGFGARMKIATERSREQERHRVKLGHFSLGERRTGDDKDLKISC